MNQIPIHRLAHVWRTTACVALVLTTCAMAACGGGNNDKASATPAPTTPTTPATPATPDTTTKPDLRCAP